MASIMCGRRKNRVAHITASFSPRRGLAVVVVAVLASRNEGGAFRYIHQCSNIHHPFPPFRLVRQRDAHAARLVRIAKLSSTLRRHLCAQRLRRDASSRPPCGTAVLAVVVMVVVVCRRAVHRRH